MLAKCRNDERTDSIWKDVLCSHLNDAWPPGVRQRQSSAEVQVMCEDNIAVVGGPTDDDVILLSRIADR